MVPYTSDIAAILTGIHYPGRRERWNCSISTYLCNVLTMVTDELAKQKPS